MFKIGSEITKIDPRKLSGRWTQKHPKSAKVMGKILLKTKRVGLSLKILLLGVGGLSQNADTLKGRGGRVEK